MEGHLQAFDLLGTSRVGHLNSHSPATSVTAFRNYKLQVLQFQNGRRIIADDDCEVVSCAIELLLRVRKLKILNLSFAI